ncbi:MAG TPA: sugar phosphate isomerase/epimerase [Galbitalea sp.]|jgi:sugar phosphate isomerase/epimerase
MTDAALPAVALQLYTVRDALSDDRDRALKRIRELGFSSVEIAGGDGAPTTLSRSELVDYDLSVVGAYFLGEPASLPVFLEEQRAVNNSTVISMHGPGSFADRDAARRAADDFNERAALVGRAGMTLGYHNHGWELAPAGDGSLAFDAFVESLDPDVFLEFDYYWAKVAGVSPEVAQAKYGDRIRRLHVKDGPLTDSPLMQVMGTGAFDVSAAVAATSGLDWLVVAFDDFDGDPLEASGQDLRYLRESGVAA